MTYDIDPESRPRKAPKPSPGQGGLFDPVRRPMARKTDPDTSRAAARVIEGSLGKIQALVLTVYRARGPMSAREAERLEEFSEYGFSTIRKRISELAHAGLLTEAGIDRSGKSPCTIYSAGV